MAERFCQVAVDHGFRHGTLYFSVFDQETVLCHAGKLAVGSRVAAGETAQDQPLIHRCDEFFQRFIPGLHHQVGSRVFHHRSSGFVAAVQAQPVGLQDAFINQCDFLGPEPVGGRPFTGHNAVIKGFQGDRQLFVGNLFPHLVQPLAGSVYDDALSDIVGQRHEDEVLRAPRRNDHRTLEFSLDPFGFDALLDILQAPPEVSHLHERNVQGLRAESCIVQARGLIPVASADLHGKMVLACPGFKLRSVGIPGDPVPPVVGTDAGHDPDFRILFRGRFQEFLDPFNKPVHIRFRVSLEKYVFSLVRRDIMARIL